MNINIDKFNFSIIQQMAKKIWEKEMEASRKLLGNVLLKNVLLKNVDGKENILEAIVTNGCLLHKRKVRVLDSTNFTGSILVPINLIKRAVDIKKTDIITIKTTENKDGDFFVELMVGKFSGYKQMSINGNYPDLDLFIKEALEKKIDPNFSGITFDTSLLNKITLKNDKYFNFKFISKHDPVVVTDDIGDVFCLLMPIKINRW